MLNKDCNIPCLSKDTREAFKMLFVYFKGYSEGGIERTICKPAILYFRERSTLQRANRRLDKKLKEFAIQAENERLHADQYKEQVK